MSSIKKVLVLLLAVCCWSLVFSACEKSFKAYTTCMNQRSQAAINALRAQMRQIKKTMAYTCSSRGGKGGGNEGCVSGIASTRYGFNQQDWVNVNFGKTFRNPPAVSYGFIHMDTDKNHNVRIDNTNLSVNRSGFRFLVKSWGGSRTYRLKFSWMACPKK